jgi:hypothetical protein
MRHTWRGPLCLALWAALAATSWARPFHFPLSLPWWHTTPHASPRPQHPPSTPIRPPSKNPAAPAAAVATVAAKPNSKTLAASIRLPGSTPTAVVARQLPTLHTLHLRNKCSSTIAVAVRMKDATAGWVTRGWYKMSPGATAATPRTHNPFFKYFAVTLDGPLVTWGGNKDCGHCYYPGPSLGDDKFPFSAAQKMQGGAYLWELSCG